jgi:hypothetical protein
MRHADRTPGWQENVLWIDVLAIDFCGELPAVDAA